MLSPEFDLKKLNEKYSIETYQKLKPSQRSVLKNQLKQDLSQLRSAYDVKMLDDDYLFSIAGKKANYSIMQLVNDFRALTSKQKNLSKGIDEKENKEFSKKLSALRKQLIETLFGSYSFLNKVDDGTIAVDPTILEILMA